MKEAIVNFFNDVAKEMRKVTWPTRPELIESTQVVIIACLIIAALSYVVDIAVTQVFKGIF